MWNRYRACMAILTLTIMSMPKVASTQVDHTVTFDWSDVTLTEVIGDDSVTYLRILMPDMQRTPVVGDPELPIYYFRLIIPCDERVEDIVITASDTLQVPLAYPVFPAQPPQTTSIGSQRPGFVGPNPQRYKSDLAYPTEVLSVVHEGYFDGSNHIVDVEVYPMQYHAQLGYLLFYSQLDFTLELRPSDTGSVRVERRLPHSQDLYDAMLESLVDNPQDIPAYSVPPRQLVTELQRTRDGLSVYEYVIITSEMHAPSFETFVQWKRDKGVLCGVVTTEDIYSHYTGDLISGIFDPPGCVRQYLFEAWQNGTVYALLAGDPSVVPIRYGAAKRYDPGDTPDWYYIIPADLYFSDFTGDWDVDGDVFLGELSTHDSPDYNPEILIGRLLFGDDPQRGAQDVANWTSKILTYEQNPGNGDFSYLTRCYLVQADQMQKNQQAQTITTMLQPVFTSDILEEEPGPYDPNPYLHKGADVVAELNGSTYGLGFSMCHGGTGGGNSGMVTMSSGCHGFPQWKWDAEEAHEYYNVEPELLDGLDNLTNYGYPNVHYSISCVITPFDRTLGYNLGVRNFGECYTVDSLNCGVAFYGNTRNGWVSSSHALQKKFVAQLMASSSYQGCASTHHLGVLEALSKRKYHSHYLDYTHHLVGCPETELWTATPQLLSVTHISQLPVSQVTNFVVTVTDQSTGSPVENAMVCVSGACVYATGCTDANGIFSYNIIPGTSDDLKVVTSKHNYIPSITYASCVTSPVTELQMPFWHFPGSALDFTSPTPTIVPLPGSPSTGHLSNGMADCDGPTMFYTVDDQMYSAAGVVLGQVATDNQTKEVAIVSDPMNCYRYYLFSTVWGEVYYSVFDRTLSAGIGDLDPQYDRVELGQHQQANGLAVGRAGADDKYYLYVATGQEIVRWTIDEDIADSVCIVDHVLDGNHRYFSSELELSHDGSKLAGTIRSSDDPHDPAPDLIYIIDLDSDGLYSSHRLYPLINPCPPTNPQYVCSGLEFAPDGAKLFSSFSLPDPPCPPAVNGVYWIDPRIPMSSPANEWTLVLNTADYGQSQLELAYDGNIYAASLSNVLQAIDPATGTISSTVAGCSVPTSTLPYQPTAIEHKLLPDQIDGYDYDRWCCCIVRIEDLFDVLPEPYPNSMHTVEIVADRGGCKCQGSFEFLIEHNPLYLSYITAEEGDVYDRCEWEFFDVEVPAPGRVKIVGVADLMDGPHHPICNSLETGESYAKITFNIPPLWSLLCQTLPLRFVWSDCEDNRLVCTDGLTEYISVSVRDVVDTDPSAPDQRLDLTDPAALSFPTYGGTPDICLQTFPEQRRYVQFLNGGIHFACDNTWAVTIQIEKTHHTYQGQYEEVSITTQGRGAHMGGFDFLIAYDASALTFMEATPGQLLEDCGWEYFTYRRGVAGNCGDACPSGLLRIVAIAETNNGPNHPSCYGAFDGDPHELATMTFLVTDNRTFECQYVPIRFFWADCADNAISSIDGNVLYVDQIIHDFEGNVVWDELDDSTYLEEHRIPFVGAPDYCLNPDPEKPTAERLINFVYGGIDIVCADSIDVRGDINLNGVSNEVADAVLFANYFVYGSSVFTTNPEGQIAASDVNADGITLSVADLVYLIRTIVGDALPYTKLFAVTAEADLTDGVLSVSAELGAAFVVVAGETTPELLAEGMELKYRYDADRDLTRVLVYSMEPGQRFSGSFLGGIEGRVISLEMATYDGGPVAATLMPGEFALHPSYPNPFNPVTTVAFSLPRLVEYELVIYNSLGQTVKTFTGNSGPGLERIEWDASDCASGVYFYRLTAENFAATKKMVLLK